MKQFRKLYRQTAVFLSAVMLVTSVPFPSWADNIVTNHVEIEEEKSDFSSLAEGKQQTIIDDLQTGILSEETKQDNETAKKNESEGIIDNGSKTVELKGDTIQIIPSENIEVEIPIEETEKETSLNSSETNEGSKIDISSEDIEAEITGETSDTKPDAAPEEEIEEIEEPEKSDTEINKIAQPDDAEITLTQKKGDVNVVLTAPAEAFPEYSADDLTLDIKEVLSERRLKEVKKAVAKAEDTLSDAEDISDIIVLDITIRNKDGEEVQPATAVSVTFENVMNALETEAKDAEDEDASIMTAANPDAEKIKTENNESEETEENAETGLLSDGVEAFHMEATGKAVPLTMEKSGDDITVEAEHFSEYVLISAVNSTAKRPILKVLPLSNYIHGEPITGTIDIGTNVEVEITSDYGYGSNLYMYKVEDDEVPPSDLNNASANVIQLKSEYKQTVKGSQVVSHFAIWGAKWNDEKAEFDDGMYLKYIMGKNEEYFTPQTRFLEPGKYRFVYGLDDPDAKIKAGPVFYSDVFTVTDETGMIARFDQGLMNSTVTSAGSSDEVSTLSQSGSYELTANGIDGVIKTVEFIKYNAGLGYNQEYIVYNEYNDKDKTNLAGEVSGNKIRFGLAKSRESTDTTYDKVPTGYYRLVVADSTGKTYVDHKLYGVTEGKVGEFRVSVSSRTATYVPNGNFKTPIMLTAECENYIGTATVKAEVFSDAGKTSKLSAHINGSEVIGSGANDHYSVQLSTTNGKFSFPLRSVVKSDQSFLPKGAVIILSFYDGNADASPVSSFEIKIADRDFYTYSGAITREDSGFITGEANKDVSLYYYDADKKYQLMKVKTDASGNYSLFTTTAINYVEMAVVDDGTLSKTVYYLKASHNDATKTGTIETAEFKDYSIPLEMLSVRDDASGNEVVEQMIAKEADALFKEAGFSCSVYNHYADSVVLSSNKDAIVIKDLALTSEMRTNPDYNVSISYRDPAGMRRSLNLSYADFSSGNAKITLRKAKAGHITTTLPEGSNKDDYRFGIYIREKENAYRLISYSDESEVTAFGTYLVAASKNYVPGAIYTDKDNAGIAFVQGTAGRGIDLTANFSASMLDMLNQKTEAQLMISDVNSATPSAQAAIRNLYVAGGKALKIILPDGVAPVADQAGTVTAQLSGKGLNQPIELTKQSGNVYTSEVLPDAASLRVAEAKLGFVMTKPSSGSSFVEVKTEDDMFLCGAYVYSAKVFQAVIGDNTGYRFPVTISNGEPGANVKIEGKELKQTYTVKLNLKGSYEGIVEISDKVLVGNNVEFIFSYEDGSHSVTETGAYTWTLSDSDDPIDLFTVTDVHNHNWKVVLHTGANSNRPAVTDAHEYFYFATHEPWIFDVYVNQSILKKYQKKIQLLAASINNAGGETKLVYLAQDEEDPTHYTYTYTPDINEPGQYPVSFGLRYCFRDDIGETATEPELLLSAEEIITRMEEDLAKHGSSITGLSVEKNAYNINYTITGDIELAEYGKQRIEIKTSSDEFVRDTSRNASVSVEHCTLPDGTKGFIITEFHIPEGGEAASKDEAYIWASNADGSMIAPYNEVFGASNPQTSTASLMKEEDTDPATIQKMVSVMSAGVSYRQDARMARANTAAQSEKGLPISFDQEIYQGYKIKWRDTTRWAAADSEEGKYHCDIVVESYETGELFKMNTAYPGVMEKTDLETLEYLRKNYNSYLEAQATKAAMKQYVGAVKSVTSIFTGALKLINGISIDVNKIIGDDGRLKEGWFDDTGNAIIDIISNGLDGEIADITSGLLTVIPDVPYGVRFADGISNNLKDIKTAWSIFKNYGSEIDPEYKDQLQRYVNQGTISFVENLADLGELQNTRVKQVTTGIAAGAAAPETAGISPYVNMVMQKIWGNNAEGIKERVFKRIEEGNTINGYPVEDIFVKALQSRKKPSNGDKDYDDDGIGPQSGNGSSKNDGSGSTQTGDSGKEEGGKKEPDDDNKPDPTKPDDDDDDGTGDPKPPKDDDNIEKKKGGTDGEPNTDKWYHSPTRRVEAKLDPSGIVYFEDTGLPAGQVKMMIYVSKSADGADAFAWVNQGEEGDAGDAAYAEIRRPSEWDEPGVQMTDHSGYYQWNVPTGYYYQVRAMKDGYEEAKSEWMFVPPIRLGVDLYLKKVASGSGGNAENPPQNNGNNSNSGSSGTSSGGSYSDSDSDSSSDTTSVRTGDYSVPSYVVEGSWSQDAQGNWMFKHSNHTYKNEWAAVYNPYSQMGEEKYGWFRFDENGHMQTGWVTDADGRKYYLNPDSNGTKGKMLTGWQLIDGKWYYFNPNSDGTRGALLINIWTPDGYWVSETGEWDKSKKQR